MAQDSIARPRSLAHLERQAEGRADTNTEPDAEGDLVSGDANRSADSNANVNAKVNANTEGYETRGRTVFVGGRWGVDLSRSFLDDLLSGIIPRIECTPSPHTPGSGQMPATTLTNC